MERVIADLSLQQCRNTRIGTATQRGISGGEVWSMWNPALRQHAVVLMLRGEPHGCT